MGHQTLPLLHPIAGPPSKMALAQPLLAQLKPLRIICQYLEGRPSLVTKNKQSPRKGIALQQLPACPGQTVDPPAKVHRFHRQPNLHLRCDLNHPPCLQKTRLSSIGSNSPGLPLKVILIRAPLVASISTTHSEAIIDDPRSRRTNRKSGPLPTTALFSPILETRSFRAL